MKRLLPACAALALAVPAASATTGSCLDVADPRGDAVFGLAVPLPSLGPLDQVDVTTLRVEATTGAVTAVFTLAGAADPAPGENYEYVLGFTDGDHDYRFEAEIAGAGLRAPVGHPFELNVRTRTTGIDGVVEESAWARTQVSGSVDLAARTVSITAPASAFGGLPAGHAFELTEMATFVGAGGTQLFDADRAPLDDTLVVGAGC